MSDRLGKVVENWIVVYSKIVSEEKNEDVRSGHMGGDGGGGGIGSG